MILLTTRICRHCDMSFPGGPRAWYCTACRSERRAQQSRDCKRRERAGTTRSLGSTDRCVVCGGNYIVNAGRQRYCPKCAPAAVKAIDRVQGLHYYRTNKDSINPVRNLKRRKGPRKCPVCKVMFGTSGRKVCCSKECRRIYHNGRWRVNYHIRKVNPA